MGSGVAYFRKRVVEKGRVASCVAGRRQRRLAPWPASLCSEEAIGNEIRGAGSKRIYWRSSWRASCSQSMACGLRRNRLGGYGPLSRMLHVNIRGSFGDGGFRGGFGLIFLRVSEPIRLQLLLSLRERGSLLTIHFESTASLTVRLHMLFGLARFQMTPDLLAHNPVFNTRVFDYRRRVVPFILSFFSNFLL
jgi:hypothetical protein